MGVKDLWALLRSSGRRIPLSALATKRLAVDASIWLTQFSKAMVDANGNALPGSHLIGMFHRISTLLMYGIKPVVVFDGPAPRLKRRTLDVRRRVRKQAEAKLSMTAEKLLLQQLSKQNVAHLRKKIIDHLRQIGEKKQAQEEDGEQDEEEMEEERKEGDEGGNEDRIEIQSEERKGHPSKEVGSRDGSGGKSLQSDGDDDVDVLSNTSDDDDNIYSSSARKDTTKKKHRKRRGPKLNRLIRVDQYTMMNITVPGSEEERKKQQALNARQGGKKAKGKKGEKGGAVNERDRENGQIEDIEMDVEESGDVGGGGFVVDDGFHIENDDANINIQDKRATEIDAKRDSVRDERDAKLTKRKTVTFLDEEEEESDTRHDNNIINDDIDSDDDDNLDLDLSDDDLSPDRLKKAASIREALDKEENLWRRVVLQAGRRLLSPEELASLPQSVQFDVMEQQRDYLKREHDRLQFEQQRANAQANPQAFSLQQLDAFARSTHVMRTVESIRKARLQEKTINGVPLMSIAADSEREYLYALKSRNPALAKTTPNITMDKMKQGGDKGQGQGQGQGQGGKDGDGKGEGVKDEKKGWKGKDGWKKKKEMLERMSDGLDSVKSEPGSSSSSTLQGEGGNSGKVEVDISKRHDDEVNKYVSIKPSLDKGTVSALGRAGFTRSALTEFALTEELVDMNDDKLLFDVHGDGTIYGNNLGLVHSGGNTRKEDVVVDWEDDKERPADDVIVLDELMKEEPISPLRGRSSRKVTKKGNKDQGKTDSIKCFGLALEEDEEEEEGDEDNERKRAGLVEQLGLSDLLVSEVKTNSHPKDKTRSGIGVGIGSGIGTGGRKNKPVAFGLALSEEEEEEEELGDGSEGIETFKVGLLNDAAYVGEAERLRAKIASHTEKRGDKHGGSTWTSGQLLETLAVSPVPSTSPTVSTTSSFSSSSTTSESVFLGDTAMDDLEHLRHQQEDDADNEVIGSDDHRRSRSPRPVIATDILAISAEDQHPSVGSAPAEGVVVQDAIAQRINRIGEDASSLYRATIQNIVASEDNEGNTQGSSHYATNTGSKRRYYRKQTRQDGSGEGREANRDDDNRDDDSRVQLEDLAEFIDSDGLEDIDTVIGNTSTTDAGNPVTSDDQSRSRAVGEGTEGGEGDEVGDEDVNEEEREKLARDLYKWAMQQAKAKEGVEDDDDDDDESSDWSVDMSQDGERTSTRKSNMEPPALMPLSPLKAPRQADSMGRRMPPSSSSSSTSTSLAWPLTQDPSTQTEPPALQSLSQTSQPTTTPAHPQSNTPTTTSTTTGSVHPAFATVSSELTAYVPVPISVSHRDSQGNDESDIVARTAVASGNPALVGALQALAALDKVADKESEALRNEAKRLQKQANYYGATASGGGSGGGGGGGGVGGRGRVDDDFRQGISDFDTLRNLAVSMGGGTNYANTTNSYTHTNTDSLPRFPFSYPPVFSADPSTSSSSALQHAHVGKDPLSEVKYMLSLMGVPYITAYAEAEAQCAALERLGLVDGVVSDDSDTLVLGARHVYRHLFSPKHFVTLYCLDEIEAAMHFDRDALICLALLLGGDYSEGIKGIGHVNAIEVVSSFPGIEGLREFKAWANSNEKDKKPYVRDDVGNPLHSFTGLTDEQKLKCIIDYRKQVFKYAHRHAKHTWWIPPNFPDIEVYNAYRHPSATIDIISIVTAVGAMPTRVYGSNPSDESAYHDPLMLGIGSDLSSSNQSNNTKTFKWTGVQDSLIETFLEERLGWETAGTRRKLQPVLDAYAAIYGGTNNNMFGGSYNRGDNVGEGIGVDGTTGRVKKHLQDITQSRLLGFYGPTGRFASSISEAPSASKRVVSALNAHVLGRLAYKSLEIKQAANVNQSSSSSTSQSSSLPSSSPSDPSSNASSSTSSSSSSTSSSSPVIELSSKPITCQCVWCRHGRKGEGFCPGCGANIMSTGEMSALFDDLEDLEGKLQDVMGKKPEGQGDQAIQRSQGDNNDNNSNNNEDLAIVSSDGQPLPRNESGLHRNVSTNTINNTMNNVRSSIAKHMEVLDRLGVDRGGQLTIDGVRLYGARSSKANETKGDTGSGKGESSSLSQAGSEVTGEDEGENEDETGGGGWIGSEGGNTSARATTQKTSQAGKSGKKKSRRGKGWKRLGADPDGEGGTDEEREEWEESVAAMLDESETESDEDGDEAYGKKTKGKSRSKGKKTQENDKPKSRKRSRTTAGLNDDDDEREEEENENRLGEHDIDDDDKPISSLRKRKRAMITIEDEE